MTAPIDAWTDRIRLHGGRLTHAARPTTGFPDGITACGYPIDTRDTHLNDHTDITCHTCHQRAW
jgi:hypothetical protein